MVLFAGGHVACNFAPRNETIRRYRQPALGYISRAHPYLSS